MCWITGGHTIHPPIERLLPQTGTEATLFQSFVSIVPGLQVHATTHLLLQAVFWSLGSLSKHGQSKSFMVAPRVENTEVFKKGWNFANQTYFASCIMKNIYYGRKKQCFFCFFCFFYHEIIFYSTELSECTINFKLYLNIFIFLNISTNQTSKEEYLNKKAATYFGISSTKRFWR